ncbi:MAG: glycosyltransferase family 4 protein, partial [Nanoarchaeota archaeon]
MKVLMFGWEFPPMNSGGLGTACFGLTKGLSKNNVAVTFVMPKGPDIHHDHCNVIVANNISLENVEFKNIPSLLVPYISSGGYDLRFKKLLLKGGGNGHSHLYGHNLLAEVYRFGELAALIAELEEFDVIHAHDWMTYPAGMKAKKATGKPLVIHVHATEFDRTGFNGVNQVVYDIEREGMHTADRIITVSKYTKDIVTRHYGVSPDKIDVVHNAVEFTSFPEMIKKEQGLKTVLFLGRITLQKGPEYFIEAARKVIDKDPNVRFIIAGSGDMEHRMVELAAGLGIAKNVLFSGFLTGEDIDRAYRMADLYVLPSVSEPFGITPLEAMRNGTPVIISNTSGVSEVISHCLRVDFWDVDEMASKILSVLHYTHLHSELQEQGNCEVKKFSWEIPAR